MPPKKGPERSDLESEVGKWPEEISPIVRILTYGNLPKAKILITDFALDLIRDVEEPSYELFRKSPRDVSNSFGVIDDFLGQSGFREQLGEETKQLVDNAKSLSSTEDLSRLKGIVDVVRHLSDVVQAHSEYMTDRDKGIVTCFYCGKGVSEEGSDSLTHRAVYYACKSDGEKFDAPDRYR